LQLRPFILQKPLNIRLKAKEIRVRHNLGAQFTGLGNHGGIFGNQRHARPLNLHNPAGNADFPEISARRISRIPA
jgi:hypothetical protein